MFIQMLFCVVCCLLAMFQAAGADFASPSLISQLRRLTSNVRNRSNVQIGQIDGIRRRKKKFRTPHQGGGSATWRKCGVMRRMAQIIEGCPDRYSPHHLDAPSSLLLRNETRADPMRRNAALFIERVDRRRSMRHLRANTRVSVHVYMWVSISTHPDQDPDVIMVTYALPHLS